MPGAIVRHCERTTHMSSIVLVLITTIGAFALHILMVFVLVSKKK